MPPAPRMIKAAAAMLALLGAAALPSVLASSALASTGLASAVSSNWAGYVAAPTAAVGARFSSVSGSWTEPAATCAKSGESYSAVWVGLGGAREGAHALEQVGTDADCTSSGRPVYSSWYELLPAEATGVRLAVHPGDRMTASVTVGASHVTLRLRNLSTGKRFTVTRRVASIDVSSAEWIVEAPSLCDASGPCRTVALTDFGQVAFTTTSATAHGHTGPIADPGWSATALTLHQDSFPSARRSAAAPDQSNNLIAATPSPAEGPGGAFAVTWQQQDARGESSAAPTLPGASGG